MFFRAQEAGIVTPDDQGTVLTSARDPASPRVAIATASSNVSCRPSSTARAKSDGSVIPANRAKRVLAA